MRKMYYGIIGLSALILAILPVCKTYAATFNVATAAELQAALNDADSNGEDDVINLAGNTFSTVDNGGVTFTYAALPTEDKKISLIGGGIGSTILTGGATTQVLSLVTAGATDDSPAGITLQNLSISADDAAGVTAIVDRAFILIDTVEFLEVNSGASNLLVAVSDGPITLKNSSITDFDGATAMTVNGGAAGPILLENNIVERNDIGILLSAADSSLDVIGNTFVSNRTFAVLSSSGTGNTNFSNNTIEDHNFFGANLSTNDGNITVNGNLVQNNHGVQGLSVGNQGAGTIVFTNNIIVGNDSFGGGNATLAAEMGHVTVTNNTFSDNFGAGNGVGLLIDLAVTGSQAQVFNNIFFENFSFGGVATGVDLFIQDDNDTVTDGSPGAPVTLSNNIIFSFSTTCLSDPTACNANVTNNVVITEDPLFVDGGNGDFNLLPDSPAIGAGDPAAPALPATDFAGNPMNNPPDLGALQATASILVDPSQIDFGNISTDVPNTRIITILNIGGLDLVVTDITLDDEVNFDLNFDGGDDPCGSANFTLFGGESCTIAVTFQPQDNGSFNATVTISSNDEINPNATVTLTGVGVNGGGCSCKFGEDVPPNYTWLSIFLILIPWAVRRWTLKT